MSSYSAFMYDLYKKHDKKIVKIDGISYKIRCHKPHMAIYPYKHMSYSVDLDPVNKRSEHYLKIKRKLGDDWSTDALEVSDETFTKIMKQLGEKG